MKTLKQAKVGETVKVVKLHGEGALKRRIMVFFNIVNGNYYRKQKFF